MTEKTKRVETAEARRRLIVATAATCFVERGFHQTSIRDIANRAGISLGNLYNHFDSKTALIAEIATIEAADLNEIQTEISKVDDPNAALDRFVSLYQAYCGQLDHVILSAEIISESLRNQKIATGFLENRRQLTSSLAKIVGKLNKGAAEHENLECAGLILDVLEGVSLRSVFEGKPPGATVLQGINSAVRRLAKH